MNDLNAQQIVLLTLLVSFVTSIATGIVTVSLLEQAPEPVTQTINRIVEKTVERVVPEPNENNNKPTEKEVVTVVVKEEDLTIEAVQRNSGSVVRVYEKVGDLKVFTALGLVVNNKGEFITDSSKITKRADYVAVYSNGEFLVDVAYQPTSGSFVVMAPTQKDAVGFDAGAFGDSANLKLGQTVISIAGQNSTAVSTGIVTQIIKEGEVTKLIESSVSDSNQTSGSLYITLKGEIVGIGIPLLGANSFVPSNVIKDFLAARPATPVATN